MTKPVTTVGSHMSQGPKCIDARSSLAEAEALMREADVRHLPVLDQGKVVGVVSDRDVVIAESLGPNEWDRIAVAEAMTPAPYTVRAETPLMEVLQIMIDNKYGSAVVTDEASRVIGMFTTTDALRLLSKALASRVF